MKQSIRNSFHDKSDYSMSEKIPKKDNLYLNQIDRMLRKPLRANTLNENYFQCKQKRQDLEQLMIKSISNYNFDDSSDEDDVYQEVSKDEIKQLIKQINLDDSIYALNLELQGRRILYSKNIKLRYLDKKQNYLKTDNQNLKQFIDLNKHVINDFLISLEESIINLINGIKSLIKFQLKQNDNQIAEEFQSIILGNLLSLIENNLPSCKKWLRKAVRHRKNEIFEIPDWIIEIIDKSITKFVLNFRQQIELKSKKKMEDKKFQTEFFENVLKELKQMYNNQPIESYLKENLGDMIFISHQVQNYIQQKNQSLSFESVAKRFQEENKFLFDVEHIKKIFLISQNIVYRKLFTDQQGFQRVTLSKLYCNQKNIKGIVDFMSEIHMIRRSVIRNALNGNQEFIYTLIFDSQQDILVQIQYQNLKQSGRKQQITQRIINFQSENIDQYFEQLQIEEFEFATILRSLLKSGFENNVLIEKFSQQKKQIFAFFLVHFFGYLGHQVYIFIQSLLPLLL